MQRVRVGLIGAGWVARTRHLPALKDLSSCRLSVIWSRRVENAEGVAREFGIPRVAIRWEDVVDSTEVDAVVIATPPVLHEPATLLALEAGKHVLCQARMARNVSEARRMLKAAQRSDRVTALYPPRPGLRGDQTMRRLLHDENFVGEVREVRVCGIHQALSADGYDWRSDPEVVGVNAMALGMWVEVLNRWLGPANQVVATAQNQRGRRETQGGECVEAVVPDSLVVGATLTCGATASYHFSTGASHGPGHWIEIYGSRGALIYDLGQDAIRGGTLGDDELTVIDIPPHEERGQHTDAEFVRAILDRGRVSPDFVEGVQYMEFCEAVACSAATGQAVPLPLAEPVMEAWGQFLEEGTA